MFIYDLCDELNRAKIKYCIVGGYAVALHGALRGTVDIDIVITLTQNGISSIERALKRLGLESRIPVTAKDIFQFRMEYINNRNLTAWGFYNPSNQSQVVDVLITEDVNSINIKKLKHGSHQINIASIDDLIRMKRKSNREIDRSDIAILKELK